MTAPDQNYGTNVPLMGPYQGQPGMQSGHYFQQQPGLYSPANQGAYQAQGSYQLPYPAETGSRPTAAAAYGPTAPPQGYPPVSFPSTGQVPEKSPWNPSQATAYNGPDVANEDLDENHQNPEQLASAPSYDLVVSGYENMGPGTDMPVGPPPAYEPPQNLQPALVDSSRIPAITDEEAREALIGLVAQKTCWGSGAAKAMKIRDITPTNAYHYTLESYTEGRSTSYAHVPFKGGYVDGPANGQAPMPWDIPCNSTALFKTEIHKIPVAHTDVVKTCHNCYGRGFTRCSRCWGRGNVRCSMCHGSGHRRTTNADGHTSHSRCLHCHGHGRKRCLTCHGSGCVICRECEGYCNIKQFIQLTVNYVNRLSDHIVEKTDLPDHLIRNVKGDQIFEQTQARVRPIQDFFEAEINQKSTEMVNSHCQSWPTERILQQRHILRSIPVHECRFEYKGKPGRFWVYGHQRSVYTEDYPHTCCCCTIL